VPVPTMQSAFGLKMPEGTRCSLKVPSWLTTVLALLLP
jgi:hypothetical protein